MEAYCRECAAVLTNGECEECHAEQGGAVRLTPLPAEPEVAPVLTIQQWTLGGQYGTPEILSWVLVEPDGEKIAFNTTNAAQMLNYVLAHGFTISVSKAQPGAK